LAIGYCRVVGLQFGLQDSSHNRAGSAFDPKADIRSTLANNRRLGGDGI
jgi:hypothetical protein